MLERITLYGKELIVCHALRASLAEGQCRDNYLRGKCLACKGCTTGRELSGEQPKAEHGRLDRCTWHRCVACEETAHRLIENFLFCPSCWNRRSEVLAGRNRKGKFPVATASGLRHTFAMIQTDAKPPASGRLIHIERYAPGALWLAGLTSGTDELARIVERLMPGAVVLESEFGSITPG